MMNSNRMSSTLTVGVASIWLCCGTASAQSDEPALPCCDALAGNEPTDQDRRLAAAEPQDDAEVRIVDGDGNVLFEGDPADMPPALAQRVGAGDRAQRFEDDAYPDGGGPAVTSLEDSIDPLIEHFNGQRDKKRFVALLSATCPACVFGARAVRESILEAYPDGDFSVSIVWTDMLPGDDQKTASRSARLFNDSRVTQFYDPNRRAGDQVSSELLNEGAGPAWDIYMFFDEGATWGEAPAVPTDWYHQLSGARRADPERFRTGDALVNQLRESAGRWLRSARVKPNAPTVKRASATQELKLLYIQECPNHEVLRARLAKVLESCKMACTIRGVDLAKLPESDVRRSFGSPTVLFNGRDIFGGAPNSSRALTCRLYAGGAAPSIAALCKAVCDTVCTTPGVECCATNSKANASCCTISKGR